MQSAILRRPLVGRALSLAFVLALAAALMLAGATSASAQATKNGLATSCEHRNENSKHLPDQASDRAEERRLEAAGVATHCPSSSDDDDDDDDNGSEAAAPVPVAVGAGTGGQQAATTAGMTAMLAAAGLAAAFGRRALRALTGRA